tara:strand:- start:327 stop:464 length:138 start_codon:yes stop_codon:yes gene_type:complete
MKIKDIYFYIETIKLFHQASKDNPNDAAFGALIRQLLNDIKESKK